MSRSFDRAIAIDEGRRAAIRQADPHALLSVVSLSSLTGRDVPAAIERFPRSFARSYARQMREEASRRGDRLLQTAERHPIWPEGQVGLFYANPEDRPAPLAGKTASAVAADLEAIPLGELPRERLDQHIARVSADVAVARPCREDGPTLHGQVPGPEQAGELREAGLESHRGQSDE